MKNETMTYSEFVSSRLKPGSDVIPTLTDTKADLIHCAVGVSGESGEVLDLLKKHVFNNRDLDREKLIEELGDIEFYLQGIRTAIGVSRDEVISVNVGKLSKRYQNGYSDAASAARADEK